MRSLARVVLAVVASIGLSSAASAKVHIIVDLDAQTMHVEANDKVFDWKVSSGKPGYETPNGAYGVLWMDKDHHSDEYDGAYMPNAIFFAPGFAIHGFGKSPWGHKASHGCIRIPTAKSAILWDLVKTEGGADVNIVGETTGTVPSKETIASSRAQRGEDGGAPRYSDDARDDGFDRAAGQHPGDGANESLFNSVY